MIRATQAVSFRSSLRALGTALGAHPDRSGNDIGSETLDTHAVVRDVRPLPDGI